MHPNDEVVLQGQWFPKSNRYKDVDADIPRNQSLRESVEIDEDADGLHITVNTFKRFHDVDDPEETKFYSYETNVWVKTKKGK